MFFSGDPFDKWKNFKVVADGMILVKCDNVLDDTQ